MKKSNVIVSVICAVAIAMTSIQYSTSAAGGTSTTYNSNGIIEYDDNDDGTAEIVFDASDFERIDNVVTSGKNQIAADINTATGISVPQHNGTYSFSDISSVLQGINNNGSVSQTLNAGDTFTIPKGYHDGTGIVTANGLAGQTPGTATDDKILQGYTAWVNGLKKTGNIPSLGAKTYSPGTSDQTIASGQYLSGAQTIKGDSNLIAANIVSGKKIFGVTGTAVVEVDSAAHSVPNGKTAATAAQILSGKYGWNGSSWVAGTMKDKSGSSTSATDISESTDKTQAIIKIPEAGYYDTNAELQVPIETIKNNVSSLNSSTIIAAINNKKAGLSASASAQEIAAYITAYWTGGSTNANITYTYHVHTDNCQGTSACGGYLVDTSWFDAPYSHWYYSCYCSSCGASYGFRGGGSCNKQITKLTCGKTENTIESAIITY